MQRPGFVIVVWLSAFLTVCAAASEKPAVRISLAPVDGDVGGDWRTDYDLAQPVAALDLGSAAGRAETWIVETSGLGLRVQNGREAIVGSRPFRHVRVRFAEPLRAGARSDAAIVPGPAGGVLIRTGLIHPFDADGARINAVFDITAGPGGGVFALGEEARSLSGWRSPLNHPAMIYAGPARPAFGPRVATIIDPATPAWIADEIASSLPRILAYFEQAIGGPPATPEGVAPEAFVTFAPAAPGDEGRYSVSGDALPGQFRLSLTGGAWNAPSRAARVFLRQGLAHEAAHLWQTATRPREPDPPGWIHEGAADALAAEALSALSLWSDSERAAATAAAERECAAILAGYSLGAAAAAGLDRAAYDCGAVAAAALATASGLSAADLWRRLAERAAADGGYDAQSVFELAEDVAGARFAAHLRAFAQDRHFRPRQGLASLEAAAREAAAGSGGRALGLEPGRND